jgi:polysaccharide biosynthesis protein PslH
MTQATHATGVDIRTVSSSALGRPKILFVTANWPLAPAYGGQQRVLNIAKLLSRFGEVSFVVVPPEPSDDEETVRRTKGAFDVRAVFRPLPLASQGFWNRLGDRFRHELDPGYLATDRCVVSAPERASFLDLMQEFDLLWVHNVKTANLFRISKWPRTILDVDDLQSSVYTSSAQSERNPIRRLLDLRMAWIWRRRERRMTQRFDALAVCSEQDRRSLGDHSIIYVIPNGFHLPAVPRRVPSQPPRIGFIGKLNWDPNAEGLKWFLRDVWPIIKRQQPDTHLRLVGQGSDGYFGKLGPEVAELGWMDDPAAEIATWSAMIVPIKSGGGTRIKIAEGFARKCPIVATTIGAFGYEAQHGEEILLADRPREFASACVRLLRDPELARAISERAHQRFLQRWTWDSCENTLGSLVRECLEKQNSSCIVS